MAEFAEMIEFHSFVSFSFWDQMKWFLIHQSDWNYNEMNIKQNDKLVWISESISNRKECDFHQSIIWFDCLFNSSILLSIQTNEKMEKGRIKTTIKHK